MSLSVCVLGSGSSGNCTYVASDNTRIIIDAGLSGKETAKRLMQIGVRIEDLDAVCLTHEHDDHTSALAALSRVKNLRFYANSGTIEAVQRKLRRPVSRWSVFTTGSSFSIGDLSLDPFSVPHDSYDPVGFAIRCGSAKVGVVTDIGMATELVRTRLRGCSVLVLESNHDAELLKSSNRPWSLKQRISGRQGHMSNEQSAALILDVAGPELKCVMLAHLSSECNDPCLARDFVSEALKSKGLVDVDVKLTYPDKPSDFVKNS